MTRFGFATIRKRGLHNDEQVAFFVAVKLDASYFATVGRGGSCTPAFALAPLL